MHQGICIFGYIHIGYLFALRHQEVQYAQKKVKICLLASSEGSEVETSDRMTIVRAVGLIYDVKI